MRGLGVLLVCWLCATAAQAQGSRSVLVVVHPGAPERPVVAIDEWLALLRVELAADLVILEVVLDGRVSAVVPGATLELAAPTADDPVIVTFAGSGARRTRVLHVADIEPAGRARALAIATADLVRSATASESLPPSEPPPPTREPARQEPRTPVDAPIARLERAPTLGLFALADVRSVPADSLGLFGGRAGMHLRLHERLLWTLDAGALAGRARGPSVQLDSTMLMLGTSLAAVHARSDLMLAAGVRVEAGYASFEGKGTNLALAEAPVVLSSLTALVCFRVRASLWAQVALDAGTSLRRVAVSETQDVFEPPSAMLGIGLGFGWMR